MSTVQPNSLFRKVVSELRGVTCSVEQLRWSRPTCYHYTSRSPTTAIVQE